MDRSSCLAPVMRCLDSAASMDAERSAPSRAIWIALGVAAALVGVALALWARHGSSVFVDALGLVASCF